MHAGKDKDKPRSVVVLRRTDMDTNGKETKWTEKINGLKKRIDRLKIKIARVSYLDPKILLTENTKEIYYRQNNKRWWSS